MVSVTSLPSSANVVVLVFDHNQHPVERTTNGSCFDEFDDRAWEQAWQRPRPTTCQRVTNCPAAVDRGAKRSPSRNFSVQT
jgi:hypothetical protein